MHGGFLCIPEDVQGRRPLCGGGLGGINLMNCVQSTLRTTGETAADVSDALHFMILFIASKFSLQVLIRAQHQKAFKGERRRSDCLYGPRQAYKVCLEVMQSPMQLLLFMVNTESFG